MNNNKKLIAFGEVLEDYIPKKDGGWKKLVGGAPLNFLAMAKKARASAYLITCLGTDEGSLRFDNMIKQEGINRDFIKIDPNSSLCHTEVEVDPSSGEREFSFYKENASFLSLNEDDIKDSWFNEGDTLHFGTVCLLNDRIFKAQLKAVDIANRKGCLLSFDPNFRPTLFEKGKQEKLTASFLPFADILKLSEDELNILTTNADVNELFSLYPNLKIVFLTLGANGIDLCFKEGRRIHQDSVRPRKIIDTVGCGDASFGAFMGTLLQNEKADKYNIDKLKESSYKSALYKAAKAGSLLCGQEGALPVPDLN